jgi:hypothetical protein
MFQRYRSSVGACARHERSPLPGIAPDLPGKGTLRDARRRADSPVPLFPDMPAPRQPENGQSRGSNDPEPSDPAKSEDDRAVEKHEGEEQVDRHSDPSRAGPIFCEAPPPPPEGIRNPQIGEQIAYVYSSAPADPENLRGSARGFPIEALLAPGMVEVEGRDDMHHVQSTSRRPSPAGRGVFPKNPSAFRAYVQGSGDSDRPEREDFAGRWRWLE